MSDIKPTDVFDSSSGSEFEGDSASPGGQSGGNQPKNDGRSLENLRGELLRKQEKLEGQIAALTDNISKLAGALTQRQGSVPAAPVMPQRPAVSPYGAPNPDINEYTDEQLQQVLGSGQLNPYQVRVIEQLLTERRIERKTSELLDKRDKQHLVTSAQAEARDAAQSSFPALRDPNSEFSRKVSAALKQQRESFGEFPMDEFDVANRIARQMGVEMSRVVTPGYIGKPEGGEKPVEESQGPSDEELTEIAHNLRYAMPIKRNPQTGKMERKKFNLQRIRERSKRYTESEQFYRARKIKGN